MDELVNAADARHWARALRVVPGDMRGPVRLAKPAEGYPPFFDRGEGVRVWEVDGRRYVDLMCSFGPEADIADALRAAAHGFAAVAAL